MIREAQKSDIQKIAELESAYIECAWPEKLLTDAYNDGYKFFVFEAGNGIAGYCFFKIVLDEAEFCNIAVKAEDRRKGIALELMNTAIEFTLCRGCRKIFLEVNEKNSNAIKLYEKLGFEKINVRKGYYKGENAVVMSKNLYSRTAEGIKSVLLV